MASRLTGLTPLLMANDIGETIAFYRDKLGFSLTGTFPNGDEPTWCHLTSGDAKIMFYGAHEHEHDAGHNHDDVEADDHEHLNTPSLSGVLYLNPDKLDEVWEALKDEVEVAWPLLDAEDGKREFGIRL